MLERKPEYKEFQGLEAVSDEIHRHIDEVKYLIDTHGVDVRLEIHKDRTLIDIIFIHPNRTVIATVSKCWEDKR